MLLKLETNSISLRVQMVIITVDITYLNIMEISISGQMLVVVLGG